MRRRSTARWTAAAAATLLTLAACSQPETRQPPRGTSTAASDGFVLEPQCPAVPATRAVTVPELNRVVAGLDLTYWRAADIGASALLPDGRHVWVFGDTVRAPGVSPRMVANSMLVTSGLCTSQVLAPDRGAVIPDRPDGVVHWPMSVVAVHAEGHDALVVVAGRIKRGTGGNLDFTYLGSTAIIFRTPKDAAPEFVSQFDLTPDNANPHQVNWGSAMLTHDGWIQLYGTRLPSRDSFGRELYAARAPIEDARNRSLWEFWNGKAWVRNQAAARPILAAAGGVSQTLSVDVVDDQFVMVSKRDGDLGNTVYSWVSDSPVGPWTPRRGVRADFQDPNGQLKYAPLAHPQIALSSGKLLISISRNTTDFGRLLANPELGRPVFAEIARP